MAARSQGEVPDSAAPRLRRRAMLGIAGGAALVASSGLALRAWQVGLVGAGDEAYELWRQWRAGELDGAELLVAAAVLAANPHDSQAWRFRADPSAIEVHLDPSRALGPVDPFLRQMRIGAGCAVENLVAAAAGRGLRVALDRPAGAQDTLVVRAVLDGAAPPESRHADAIGRRHTNRGPYHRNRPLGAELTAALRAQVSDPVTQLQLLPADTAEGRALAAAIIDATRRLIADPPFMAASDRWFRMNPREVALHRDGPSLDASGLGRARRWLFALAPRAGAETSHDAWLQATIDRHVGTAPMFGAICVRDPDSPEQQVAAGRLWQRLHLEATALGLGAQPLDQLPELADRQRQLGLAAAPRVAVTDPGWTAVFMFRIGHAIDPAPPSPRRELASFFLV